MPRSRALLAAVILFFAIGARSESADQATKVGYLHRQTDDGCGCSYALSKRDLSKQRYVAVTSEDEGKFYINLDGADRTCNLTALGRKEKIAGDITVGDTQDQSCRGRDFKLRLHERITATCPPDDESCEVWYSEVRVTIVKDHNKKLHLTLFSNCGC
jgi:hypothetical protein